MHALEVVLGLLLVILFYSLFATVIMEFLTGMLALRGNHLKKTLELMLGEDKKGGKTVLNNFLAHPLYNQLSGKSGKNQKNPSYLADTDFRLILLSTLNSLKKDGSWREKIGRLEEGPLSQILEEFWKEADGSASNFSVRIEKWYNDIMDRASGWYKRRVQRLLLVVGLLIAVIFNVDIINVFEKLRASSDDELARLTLVAEKISEQQATIVQINLDSIASSSTGYLESPTENSPIYQELKAALDIDNDPLGIGWEGIDAYPKDIWSWALKIFGWILMALCISKGAPFWFDLLKKVVSFRNTGNIPEVQSNPTPPARPAVTVMNNPEYSQPVG